MSADLFAEFGDPNASSQSVRAPGNVPSLSSPGSGGEQGTTGNTLVPIGGSSRDPGQDQDFDDFGEFVSSRASPVVEAPSASELFRQDEAGSSVLFDASTEEPPEEDDEWGEFESADQPSATQAGVDLLGLNIEDNDASLPTGSSQPGPTTKHPAPCRTTGNLVDLLSDNAAESRGSISPGMQKSEPAFAQSTQRKMKPTQNATLVVEENKSDEEDWAEFTDGHVTEVSDTQPQRQQLSVNQGKPATGNARMTPKGIPSTKNQIPKSDEPLRPTNIPPPSILLALFPALLEQFRRKAANLISSAKGNASVAPNPDVVYTLASTSRVMTRIIAGRTLRWKRDTILSQSTKIGPARSGKAGGMKLSSVNKNETVKEEQAASEAMEAWRKHSTVLNNAISTGGGKPVPVPVGNVHVRTATAEEGAFKASHACALCGLKRDERIPKIDEDVYDSFGEFWVDYWGHADCKVFWETNSASLDQR